MKHLYSKPIVTTSDAEIHTLGMGIITSRVESLRTTKFDGTGFGL